MAKMKWDNDIDWRGLHEEEYDESGEDFEPYDGPIPPKGTILRGVVKKVWATSSQAGDSMFKALFVAEGNEGNKAKYDGLPIWDNVNWTLPQCKFMWQPFFNTLNVTLKDVKLKTQIEDDDDNVGTPVTRIGQAKFPYPTRIVTDRETYEGEPRARVKKYIPLDEDELVDDDELDDDDVPF